MNIFEYLKHCRGPHLSIERGKPLPTRGRTVLTHAAAAYALVLALLAAIFVFGLIGISVAHGDEDYQGYIWIPRLLAIASGLLIVTTVVRAVRRWRR